MIERDEAIRHICGGLPGATPTWALRYMERAFDAGREAGEAGIVRWLRDSNASDAPPDPALEILLQAISEGVHRDPKPETVARMESALAKLEGG